MKWTLIASDLIRGVLVLALVFVHDLYLIYIILFSMSVVSAFDVVAAIKLSGPEDAKAIQRPSGDKAGAPIDPGCCNSA